MNNIHAARNVWMNICMQGLHEFLCKNGHKKTAPAGAGAGGRLSDNQIVW